MRQTLNRRALVVALSMMMLAGAAKADALITNFNNFNSDDLYAGWNFVASPPPTIVSGADSYQITATGYGSNYKYIEDASRQGAGYTTLQLAITLDGPAAADGSLGPIVTLIDTDGTRYNYGWFGQTLGSHVLEKAIDMPSWIDSPGAVPGLNLNGLQHMHMQLDPGAFGASGAYTLYWENLALTNFVPEPSSMLLLAGSIGLMFIRRS